MESQLKEINIFPQWLTEKIANKINKRNVRNTPSSYANSLILPDWQKCINRNKDKLRRRVKSISEKDLSIWTGCIKYQRHKMKKYVYHHVSWDRVQYDMIRKYIFAR